MRGLRRTGSRTLLSTLGILSSACLCHGQTADPRANADLLFNLRPRADTISPTGDGAFPLFNGTWWDHGRPPVSVLRDSAQGLQIPLGSAIATASVHSRPGTLPLLDPDKGFFVEFEVALSSNDPDHFPAVWLMPIEHDAHQNDRQEGAPPGFERWVEIDVDEGGFAPGPHGVIIEWQGLWPHYTRQIHGPGNGPTPLDRTRPHHFGFSYDPVAKAARWWRDGLPSAPYPVPWIGHHHYYLIISAQSHGARKPYAMMLRSVSAYQPRLRR